MDDAELLTFLAIVRHGTLRAASESLAVAQSTVSQRLQALEKQVGETLLERHRGQSHIRLTPEGEALMELAVRWEALTQEMERVGRQGSTLLRVGAGDSVNRYLLPPVYRGVLERAPSLRLHIESADSLRLFTLLERRDLDVAVATWPMTAHGLVSSLLMQEEMVVVMSSELEQGAGQVSSEDLDPSQEIYLAWGDAVEVWRAEAFGGFRGCMRLNPAHLLGSLLRTSHRWAIVPISVAQGLASDGVATYRLTDPPSLRTLYTVRQSVLSNATAAGVGLFEDMLASILGPQVSVNTSPARRSDPDSAG